MRNSAALIPAVRISLSTHQRRGRKEKVPLNSASQSGNRSRFDFFSSVIGATPIRFLDGANLENVRANCTKSLLETVPVSKITIY
jgi:hypothetical protein